jgi:hypothetical protein
LLHFFGDKMLSDINGAASRDYAAQRSTDAAARRELEDLRAAINHHRREGLCSQVVEVVQPPERPARERWLTRAEAARLILKAWRYREVDRNDARGLAHIMRLNAFREVWVKSRESQRTSALFTARNTIQDQLRIS